MKETDKLEELGKNLTRKLESQDDENWENFRTNGNQGTTETRER